MVFRAREATKEECLQALDGLAAQGADVLEQFHFGCMAGDHTAYAVVTAASEDAARNLVPSPIRSKARVVEVNQFTPEQIRSFHKAA